MQTAPRLDLIFADVAKLYVATTAKVVVFSALCLINMALAHEIHADKALW